MAVAIAVVTFWLGVFSVLLAEIIIIYIWFVSKKVVKPPTIVKTKPKLPQVVEEMVKQISESGSNNKETCQFLNLGLSFLFQELKDSIGVKRFLMRRIQKEFEEFMLTRTQGKIVEQLTVRDYCLGKQLPVFKHIQVIDVKHKDSLIENIDISVDVEYEGVAQICIDADLILGKCACVLLKICKVKGQARLQFTRDPFTNWSFSFYDTPELQLEVECQLDGRQFTQLSTFLENQIHKWVKKKHTLPNYKQRFLPFFPQPIPHDQRVEVYVHDNKLTVGQLIVEVIECSHLHPMQCPAQLFCSLQLAEGPNQPLSGMWRMLWPVMECSVARPADGDPIGATFVKTSWREKEEEKHELVVVKSVTADSPAGNAGICKGDVVYSINHMKVTNAKSIVKLLHRINTERFLFTMMRPPLYAQSELLTREQKKHKHHMSSTADGDPQDIDKLTVVSSKVKKKKIAKNYLKHEDKLHRQLPIFGDLDPNLPSECVVDSYDSRHHSEVKMKLTSFYSDYGGSCDHSGSLDDNHLKSSSNHKERLTRSTSVISRSVVDPPLTVSGSSMDCVYSVTDRQPTSNCDICTTSLKSACQNPYWNEKFTFLVLPSHQYLNITLWSQLEDEKDFAVAHVSISLVDIATQCLSTSSCTHTQHYVMLPNEPVKFGSSRSVIKLTGSRGNIIYEGVYGGDVLLKLTHFTEHRKPPEVDVTSKVIEQDEEVDQLSDHQGTSSDEESMFGTHVLLQNEPAEKLKTDHDFQPTEVKNVPARCVICSKKFWGHRVLQCVHCKLFCHKKCTLYCMRQVPCNRKTCGYHIEKDDHVSSKMDEHDFEQSISSQLSRDIVSASETESEEEFPQLPSEAQIRYRLGAILAEMDSIKDTYNTIGMANPANDEEAKSISATQENLTVKLDTLKQEMLQRYEELNRLDEDNLT